MVECTTQGNGITWEKNGQLKSLKADAVFTNDATQGSVYHSVSGAGLGCRRGAGSEQ
jgi:hypothetical protein